MLVVKGSSIPKQSPMTVRSTTPSSKEEQSREARLTPISTRQLQNSVGFLPNLSLKYPEKKEPSINLFSVFSDLIAGDRNADDDPHEEDAREVLEAEEGEVPLFPEKRIEEGHQGDVDRGEGQEQEDLAVAHALLVFDEVVESEGHLSISICL